VRLLALLVIAACGGGATKPPPPQTPEPPKPEAPKPPPAVEVTALQLHGSIASVRIEGDSKQLAEGTFKELVGKPLDRETLRLALDRVMASSGVGRAEARGVQQAAGIELVIVVEPAPKVRKITAMEGGKEVAITGLALLPTGLPLDPTRIDQVADRVRSQFKGRTVEVTWKRVPVNAGEVDVVLEVTE
jgi:hypothetical protein